jgi:ankyrin repeat protein
VEALVESGAQVDAETGDYCTALQLAAAGGHTGCCKALIEAGAIVDAQGGPQRSAALHLAAAGGHTPTVRLLLEEGADTSLRDRQVRPVPPRPDPARPMRSRIRIQPDACLYLSPRTAP